MEVVEKPLRLLLCSVSVVDEARITYPPIRNHI